VLHIARTVRGYTARGLLAARVFVLLVVMRGVVRAFSLKRITDRLGTRLLETPADVAADQLRYARRVSWAITRVSPRTPTNSNCYPQGLTAWWLLHRKGIPSTFYYGAAFDEDGTALQAHVWVRCGPLIVTGGGSHRRRFAPLVWYGDGEHRASAVASPPSD
jgi:hypothetical protein